MDQDITQVSRLEVVDSGRRRRWTLAEKLRIVEESYRGSEQASATARRHGISSGLLFKWRRAFRDGDFGDADGPGLVPAVIEPSASLGIRGSHRDGLMEIVIAPDRRVIVGCDVDRAALTLVLDVLARR